MDFYQRALKSSIHEPKIIDWSLQNGTKCVMAPMPDAPLTCLDFWCKAGSSVEEPGEEGMAHFLEHMVFKGSHSLNAGEFDKQIEELGGSSNAATGFDDVHFYVLVPPDSASEALELLLNLVLTPSLTSDAYYLEREVVLEEIAQYNDQPEEQLIQKLLETCWGEHPYGRKILGFEASLKSSEPKRMRAFHNRNYVGKNCCISIAGVIPEGIKDLLTTSKLGELTKGKLNLEKVLNGSEPKFNAVHHEIEIERLESARLLMAWPLPPAKNQKMIMGADLTTSLLSEGRRSRLVHHLREELQIVESIDMDVTVLEQGSIIMLEACCQEKNLLKVEKEVFKQLTSGLYSCPSDVEINRARQLVKSGHCFSLEASSQVAGLAGSQVLWGRSASLLEPLKHFSYWTPDQIHQEIFPLLCPKNSCTILARPKKK